MIIDGKLVAAETRIQIKQDVKKFVDTHGYIPSLAVIVVGNNPASAVYVRNKHKACLEVGINSIQIEMPEDTTEEELLAKIVCLNFDKTVNGILVQLPLPKHIDEQTIIKAIDPLKDVDAFNPENVGKIMLGNYDFVPCTPAGIMALIDYYNIDLKGKKVLIIGRSNIVGKPLAHLLLERNATVIMSHSKTYKDDMLRLFATSDIVISATGCRNVIDEDDAWQYFKDYRHDFYKDFSVKRDRVIIDVGINRNEDGKLCGDFDEEFKKKYSQQYTPVPGGVGPMTITMLLKNTLKAADMQLK